MGRMVFENGIVLDGDSEIFRNQFYDYMKEKLGMSPEDYPMEGDLMSSETNISVDNTSIDEEENFYERFCSGTFKPVVLSEDGFDILKAKGLI